MKPGVLVLGLGNRLMMDDGIGVAVVEALAERGPAAEGIDYVVGETDFAYCLEVAGGYDRLLVVDAAVTGRRPGEVAVLPLGDLAARGRGISMHDLHLIDLLVQGRSVHQGVLIGIEPFEVDVGYGLSPVLAAQFDVILGRARAAVDRVSLANP